MPPRPGESATMPRVALRSGIVNAFEVAAPPDGDTLPA
jgi:hypothetical protein